LYYNLLINHFSTITKLIKPIIMKNLKNYGLAIITIALLWSCQKEENVVRRENSEVQFFACYNNLPNTKATTTFTTSNKATIYACIAAAVPSSTTFVSGTPLEATSQAGGVLTPTTPLYLPKGSYDFYSVANNTNVAAGLTFTSGVSGQLSNNIDYLWAKAPAVSEGGIVNFTYNHKAVSLEINVAEGTGVSSLEVISIKITPSKPNTSSTMNLATGTITPSTQKDVATAMELSGKKGIMVMLPMQSISLDIEVVVNAIIGGTQVNNKKYVATITPMVYIEGTYYKLNLSVDAKEITFLEAQVEDWTTQTISATTLNE